MAGTCGLQDTGAPAPLCPCPFLARPHSSSQYIPPLDICAFTIYLFAYSICLWSSSPDKEYGSHFTCEHAEAQRGYVTFLWTDRQYQHQNPFLLLPPPPSSQPSGKRGQKKQWVCLTQRLFLTLKLALGEAMAETAPWEESRLLGLTQLS